MGQSHDVDLFQEKMIQEMEARLGRPLQTAVRQAFLQVPRHLFIDDYYRQQGNSLTWDLITQPSFEEVWTRH